MTFRNSKHKTLMIACGAALVAAGACTSLTKIKKAPAVRLETVAMGAPDAQGALVIFGVAVENPNSVPLEVDSVEYSLEIDGKQVGSGSIDARSTVPALGKATLQVPVHVRLEELLQSVFGFLQSGSRHYRVKGTARIGLFRLPFEKSGDVDMSGLK